MHPRISSLLVLALGAHGMSAGPADLPLREVIQSALENNFSYRIASLEPEIARDGVTGEEAAFDVEVFASGELSRFEQTTIGPQSGTTSSDNRGWNAGARKRLTQGATVTAQTNLYRGVSDSRPLSQTADFSVSIRQPLLQGYGTSANTAAVKRARAGLAASSATWRQAVLDLLARTETAYWQVARFQEQLQLDQSNMEVAEALVEETFEKERLGLATRIDLLQAEAFKAESLEKIITTKRALGDAFDQLLAYMGTLPGSSFPKDLDSTVSPLPENGPPVPEFQATWVMALASDPSLEAQSARIDQRKLDQTSSRDRARPRLDLVLSGAYSGADGESADRAYRYAIDREGEAWSVGFEFSMPWSRRQEKATIRIADKRLEQDSLRYDELKQALYQEVRASWRSLSAVQQSMEAARLTVSLQEASFEREKGKYEQGLSDFRDVLEAQRDLDQARVRLLGSKFTKLATEIELGRLAGTLFERHGIPAGLTYEK
jgi:outer membrane protein